MTFLFVGHRSPSELVEAEKLPWTSRPRPLHHPPGSWRTSITCSYHNVLMQPPPPPLLSLSYYGNLSGQCRPFCFGIFVCFVDAFFIRIYSSTVFICLFNVQCYYYVAKVWSMIDEEKSCSRLVVFPHLILWSQNVVCNVAVYCSKLCTVSYRVLHSFITVIFSMCI